MRSSARCGVAVRSVELARCGVAVPSVVFRLGTAEGGGDGVVFFQ